ncbi:MAG TPA: urease accessory protein UreH [Blastocatellia bacterium]|nr:urease accessory protein UreH [Blastocatellia bacterium]
MDSSISVILASGFVWGLHHALDPDHLVAVSTIVSEHKSVSRSSLVGTFWGVGHTSSLLLISLIVLLLRASIPENIARWMEAPVALMLVALGITTIIRAVRERGWRIHSHTHTHDESSPHTHLHIHLEEEHAHQHRFFKIGKRPFVVGMVHGVAGSAALTLLVLSTIPSVALGLLYIGVFGVGSIGGMLLMSALIGLPFALTARRYAFINGGIRLVAGAVSIVYGLVLAWNL